MKKFLSRLICTVLTVTLFTSALCITASAGSEIRFSDHYSVIVGQSVTVTMTVKEAAGYDIWLAYDSSRLQYTGNDSRIVGGGGSLHVIDFDMSGNGGNLTIKLPFKTVATGTAKVTISGQTLSDANGDTVSDVYLGNSTVQIINQPTASSDSSLKALSISPGSLYPAFSSQTTNYSVTVSSTTTKLAVSATANHSKAKVSVSGNGDLKVGTNWVTVTVTAEDGSKTNYSIQVTRNASTENPVVTPTPEPTPSEPVAYVGLSEGNTAPVANEIPEDKIPKGFTLGTITVDGIEVPAVTYHEDGLPAVYLEGGDSVEAGFYFVDVKTGLAFPVTTVTSEKKLIMLDIALADIPEGYELGKFTIGETEHDVLIPAGAEKFNHCLVYAMNDAGECVLYQYDPADGTYQRYGFTDIGGEEPEPTPTTAPEETPVPSAPVVGNEPDGGADREMKVILLGISAVAVVLFVLMLIFMVKYFRKASAYRLLEDRSESVKVPPAEKTGDESGSDHTKADGSDDTFLIMDDFDIDFTDFNG